MLKEKQQPANGIPSMGSYPRRGRRPRRPGNLLLSPIPGKTPGLGMPGPYRAAVGKPHAVHKRPRRGQDPSLRTDPSTSAGPPPQVRAATRQRAATHVGGGVPDAPETSHHRPSPGPPRAGHARPLPRGGGQAPCRPQTPAEGSRPLPTDRPINECPPPAARQCGNGDKKTEAIPFPGTASVLI